MPLYEYECEACGQRFELIRKHSDPPVDVCTLCGKGPVSRLFSSPAIQFKGSGWYITDYAQKGKGEKKTDAASGSGKPTETKPDGGSASDKTPAASSDAAGKSDSASSSHKSQDPSHKSQGTGRSDPSP